MSTKENRVDISDELFKLIQEAINVGFGQIQEEDDEVLPALITPSSIIALPVQKLNEIFPMIQKLLESSDLKQGALVYNVYLTLESKRTRAMFAEGWEYRASHYVASRRVLRTTFAENQEMFVNVAAPLARARGAATFTNIS